VKIFARRHDKATIFDVSGDIDSSNAQQVHHSLQLEIQKSSTARVVVNLSQVRYIDSRALPPWSRALKRPPTSAHGSFY